MRRAYKDLIISLIALLMALLFALNVKCVNPNYKAELYAPDPKIPLDEISVKEFWNIVENYNLNIYVRGAGIVDGRDYLDYIKVRDPRIYMWSVEPGAAYDISFDTRTGFYRAKLIYRGVYVFRFEYYR